MDWKFERRTKSCSNCTKPFEPESNFFSALYTFESTFARKDFCQVCWEGIPKENVFSYWKTVMPELGAVKKQDTKPVLKFLEKCCFEKDLPGDSVKLAYLSALFLSRKREIKIQGTREIDNKVFIVIVPRTVCVEWLLPVPCINESEIQKLEEEFKNLFTIQSE